MGGAVAASTPSSAGGSMAGDGAGGSAPAADAGVALHLARARAIAALLHVRLGVVASAAEAGAAEPSTANRGSESASELPATLLTGHCPVALATLAAASSRASRSASLLFRYSSIRPASERGAAELVSSSPSHCAIRRDDCRRGGSVGRDIRARRRSRRQSNANGSVSMPRFLLNPTTCISCRTASLAHAALATPLLGSPLDSRGHPNIPKERSTSSRDWCRR